MAPILYWHEVVYKPTPWVTRVILLFVDETLFCSPCLLRVPQQESSSLRHIWLQTPSRTPVPRMHSTSVCCQRTRPVRKSRSGTGSSTCAGGSSDSREASFLTMTGKHG